MNERARLLQLLRDRIVSVAEMELAGASSCGMLCAGGSERRGCACSGPMECPMKQHPFYGPYIQYRSGQMNKTWRLKEATFTAPGPGRQYSVRGSYDIISGEYVFDIETK